MVAILPKRESSRDTASTPGSNQEIFPAAVLAWELDEPGFSLSSFSCLETSESSHHFFQLHFFTQSKTFVVFICYTAGLDPKQAFFLEKMAKIRILAIFPHTFGVQRPLIYSNQQRVKPERRQVDLTYQDMPHILIGSFKAAEADTSPQQTLTAPHVTGCHLQLPHTLGFGVIHFKFDCFFHICLQKILQQVVFLILEKQKEKGLLQLQLCRCVFFHEKEHEM